MFYDQQGLSSSLSLYPTPQQAVKTFPEKRAKVNQSHEFSFLIVCQKAAMTRD
jgi:hypothetical protein